MRFSERKGYKEVSEIIQIEGINTALKNSLWNFLKENIFSADDIGEHKGYVAVSILKEEFEKEVCKNFLKIPIGKFFPESHFFKFEWYEIYDFIEFTCDFFKIQNFQKAINQILERELAGYRIINGIVTDVTNEQEIEMLVDALIDEDFPNVQAHLQRALELLSDKKSPDYRNSIKESISAVESIAREIANKPKATLGEALKEIEKRGEFHKALKEGFLKLYGYTSDANGIRHAMMDEPNLTADDAKFFLLVCTSFINYLKTKM